MTPPLALSRRHFVGFSAASAGLATLGAPLLHPAGAHAGEAPATSAAGRAVSWDAHSFSVAGERLNVWSGEFHHWRLPSPEHWRDLLQKMRAAGYNTVSLYFFWGLHQSELGGDFDFSGIGDIDTLLTMAAEEGLYVVARPGPYINAEVSMGGLPSFLVNREGSQRTTEPAALAASLAWLSAVNEIIARHQVTDGGGTVVLYQVENELIAEDAERIAFLRALADSVRQDGITVPLFHNDYGLGGRFADLSTTGLDFYAYDQYPLGFNAGGQRNRIGEAEESFRGFAPDSPHFVTESQGGAFTPWGASFNADQAYAFTDPAFTRQWSVRNIGNGVTAFNYYMIFGGTNWGWTGSPSSGFTSYDYGAAITEDRKITEKFTVQKEYGYYFAGVPECAASDPAPAPAVTVHEGAAVLAYQRIALDAPAAGGLTRRLVGVRLADSNDTTDTRFSLALHPGDAAGGGEWVTSESEGDAVVYRGAWEQTADPTALGGSYRASATTGDTATHRFTGTRVQVITPTLTDFGVAEVSLDGAVHGTFSARVDSDQNKPAQQVSYEIGDLAHGEHEVVVRVTGQTAPGGSNNGGGSRVAVDGFRSISDTAGAPNPGPASVRWPVVPQAEGTTLRLPGRDALQLTLGGLLGPARLGYTTSLIFGAALPRRGGHVQYLVGQGGEPGETVLLFDEEPAVNAGAAHTVWDAARGELRVNYTHGAPEEITVTPRAGTPLTLRIMDRTHAASVWLLGGPDAHQGEPAPVIAVEGANVALTVRYEGASAHVTGHLYGAATLRIDAPDTIKTVHWNGRATAVGSGPVSVAAPGPQPPAPVQLAWRGTDEAPEAHPAFDASGWTLATATDGFNGYQTVGSQGVVLDSNRYGYFTGSVWYRGEFTGAPGSTVRLNGNGGTGQPGHGKAPAFMQAWINGTYLGAVPAQSDWRELALAEGIVRVGEPNVIAVVVHNLGLNLDWSDDGLSKQTRGLWDANLPATDPAAWRITGAGPAEWAAQGERRMFNVGGLFGERHGWHEPTFNASAWTPAATLTASAPGIRWYRSEFTLHTPPGQETAYRATIHSERFDAGRTDGSQVLIFVNGWNAGVYIGDIGPQHEFTIPSGWLRANGRNMIAAVVCAKSAGQGPQSITLDPVYTATLAP
ncbi:beta-galactosidase [Micrococcales bacterium 31B]|nr:beta-galactosidase [Micrococcales bacterium 31B]